MRRLKTLSLFKIAFLFVLIVYFKNIYISIFALLYLLTIDYKNTLFLFLLIILKIISSYSCYDYLPLGYVEEISGDKAIINKILYKVEINDIDNFKNGDIVYFNSIDKNNEEKLLKNNIIFKDSEDIKIISNFSLYKATINRLNNFNKQSVFKKLLFNDYVDENELDYYLGYGFCFYYLLRILYYKNKYLSIDLMLIYSLFFGFDIKYFLLIIDFILSFFDFDNIDNFSIKLIVISILNEYLFLNYSILISLLFSFINILDNDKRYLYLMILQSYFFNQVQLLNVLLYKYVLKIRIFIFLFALICFVFGYEGIVFEFILNMSSFFLKIFSFTLRGKVSYITLLILVIFKVIFKSNNLKLILVFLLFLISPLNNPFKQVSFIDIGQGDAILLRGTLNSYNVLIDTGSTYNYYKLKNYLFSKGIYKIDYLIITHYDNDHSGNIDNLRNDFKIINLIDIKKDVEIGDLYLKNINLGEYENENNNSLVYYTNVDNCAFLFTGDIGKEIERLIPIKTNIKKINVLKVSHHGSKTSTDRNFISNILPDFAIISTNGMYSHPHNETLDTLNDYLCDIYITKDDKDIEFYFLGILRFLKADNKLLIF